MILGFLGGISRSSLQSASHTLIDSDKPSLAGFLASITAASATNTLGANHKSCFVYFFSGNYLFLQNQKLFA
jgi:hypothetical protein